MILDSHGPLYFPTPHTAHSASHEIWCQILNELNIFPIGHATRDMFDMIRHVTSHN